MVFCGCLRNGLTGGGVDNGFTRTVTNGHSNADCQENKGRYYLNVATQRCCDIWYGEAVIFDR
jgi:hypothetical protein